MTKKDDEARKKILARRATFVAAALAGVSTACGKEPSATPQPCLSQPLVRDDGAGPQPCLEPMPAKPDAGEPVPCLTIVAPPTQAEDGGKPPPRPCLSPVRPPIPPPPQPEEGGGPKPPPQPCLKIVPPKAQ